MNPIKSTFMLLAGVVALSGVALAKEPKAAVAPAALQLQVDLPFVHDLFVEQDLSEALAATVRETFRRHGYQGGIAEVASGEKPSADRPVLTVKLINWRGSRTGFIDCAFSATLTTPDGTTHSLGLFTGSEMNLGSRTRWDVAQTFVDAAEEASRALWRSMDQKDLLPAAQPAATPVSTPGKPVPANASLPAGVVE